MSKKTRYGPPSAYFSVSLAADVDVGISPVALEIAATFSGFVRVWTNSQAPSVFGQAELIPHCQDAPPIFGPLPRSGGGRKSASAPTFLLTSSAAQLPVYHSATRPW